MNGKCNQKDVVINIKDLLMHICMHWRSIVVIVLIFTFLATGYKFLADFRNYTAATAELNSESIAVEDTEKEAYSNAVNVANLYKQYISRNEYIANSPLMKINANEVPTYTVSYAVKGNNCGAVVNMHTASVINGEDLKSIETALGDKFKAEYVSELITVENNDVGAGFESVSDDEVAGFTVTVIAPDSESLKTIADAIRARILINHNAIKLSVGNYGMELIEENYSTRYNFELFNKQHDNSVRCNDTYNIYTAALEKLTDEENEYYQSLINENTATEPSKPSISKKYLLLGFAGGLIVAICLYAATYVFGNKVKGFDDAVLRYDLYFLGAIAVTDQKKKWFGAIDRLIIKLFDKRLAMINEEKNTAVINEKISLEAAKVKCKEVNIIGTALTEAEAASLSSLLKAKGIKFRFAGNVLDNPKLIAEATEKSAYLIAEKVKKSYYADVYEELEILTRNESLILGSIVLY